MTDSAFRHETSQSIPNLSNGNQEADIIFPYGGFVDLQLLEQKQIIVKVKRENVLYTIKYGTRLPDGSISPCCYAKFVLEDKQTLNVAANPDEERAARRKKIRKKGVKKLEKGTKDNPIDLEASEDNNEKQTQRSDKNKKKLKYAKERSSKTESKSERKKAEAAKKRALADQ